MALTELILLLQYKHLPGRHNQKLHGVRGNNKVKPPAAAITKPETASGKSTARFTSSAEAKPFSTPVAQKPDCNYGLVRLSSIVPHTPLFASVSGLFYKLGQGAVYAKLMA